MEAESRMHPRVAGPDPEFLNLMPDYLAGITLRGLAVICADLDGRRETFLLEAEHVAPKRVPLELTVRRSIASPCKRAYDLPGAPRSESLNRAARCNVSRHS